MINPVANLLTAIAPAAAAQIPGQMPGIPGLLPGAPPAANGFANGQAALLFPGMLEPLVSSTAINANAQELPGQNSSAADLFSNIFSGLFSGAPGGLPLPVNAEDAALHAEVANNAHAADAAKQGGAYAVQPLQNLPPLPLLIEAGGAPVQAATNIPLLAQAKDMLAEEPDQSILLRIPERAAAHSNVLHGLVTAAKAKPEGQGAAAQQEPDPGAEALLRISPEVIKPVTDGAPGSDDITRTLENNIFRLNLIEQKALPQNAAQQAAAVSLPADKQFQGFSVDAGTAAAIHAKPAELLTGPVKADAGANVQAHTQPQHVPPSAVDQVSLRIAGALKDGDTKIHIQLEPASLGKVEVQINLNQDHKPSVLVLADKQDTLDMLQKDARSLERSLQDAGIKADAGSLNFSLREHRQNFLAQHEYSGMPEQDGKLENLLPDVALPLPAWLLHSDKALDIIV